MDIHSNFLISQADGRPLYLQIMEQVRQRVAVGDWPPGTELPSIRQLAVALSVSVITIKRAYLELEQEGVIVTQQGKGSMVANNPGLSTHRWRQELDQHLGEAARLAILLGQSEQQTLAALQAQFAQRQATDEQHAAPSNGDGSKHSEEKDAS